MQNGTYAYIPGMAAYLGITTILPDFRYSLNQRNYLSVTCLASASPKKWRNPLSAESSMSQKDQKCFAETHSALIIEAFPRVLETGSNNTVFGKDCQN